ncbi:MAG: phospho-N-acetylmuramoyl-pentapeptide-transferase [Oscillospiraceae bacterium]|jgi:phospho-N-acetylmuramoyl-pentapeptide-transferase|nr:phospho-N-acetylmuramoyl-pentapeptide-transferase [Oscillospiraceae bacterium]
MIFPLLAGFAAAVVFAMIFIPFLRAVKAGQPIKKIGPVWHMKKEGTPTMGGWIFIVGTASGCAVFALLNPAADIKPILAIFIFALVYAVIGFIDDIKKITKRSNDGLSGFAKLLLQLAAALALILLLRYLGYLTPNLYIPFAEVTIPLPELAYEIFATFVIVGTVNAVNITDGVDGVLTGVTLPVAACFSALAFAWGSVGIGGFGIALVGGLFGFLCFNFNPAKVFMGDTGSLFLGGAIAATAFALDAPLALVPLCLIYIWEVLSDIIQVIWFKYTKRKYKEGRRVFKMAPFHHHLEKSGWSEKKIFLVFTIFSVICAAATYYIMFERYGKL